MPRELTAVRRAADKAARASQERDDAIRAAHAAGSTIRAIAAVCGLSASRVHQILHIQAVVIEGSVRGRNAPTSADELDDYDDWLSEDE